MISSRGLVNIATYSGKGGAQFGKLQFIRWG